MLDMRFPMWDMNRLSALGSDNSQVQGPPSASGVARLRAWPTNDAGRTPVHNTIVRTADRPPQSVQGGHGSRAIIRGDTAFGGVPAGSSSGCDRALVERDPELGRVGVALVARHEHVLRARRVQRHQEPRLLAADEEAVRNVVRERRIGPGFHLELLVAHERDDRALEHVDGLVLARVEVDRRLVAGADVVLHDGPLVTRLLAVELQLEVRAVAVVAVTSGAGAGQDGVCEGHALPFWFGPVD